MPPIELTRRFSIAVISSALGLPMLACTLAPGDVVVSGDSEGRFPSVQLTFKREVAPVLVGVHLDLCKRDPACTLQWMRDNPLTFCIASEPYGCLGPRDYADVFDPRLAAELASALDEIEAAPAPAPCLRVEWWPAGARWSAVEDDLCLDRAGGK